MSKGQVTGFDIAQMRLSNQLITRHAFSTPGEVVAWLGAVQAQDYPGSLWAVGLRMADASEADIEQAISERKIIRTWPMRGTLHYIAAEDVRWMLELMTPRVIASNAGRLLRQHGLDEQEMARSRKLVANALQGNKQLTRQTLYRELEAGGVVTGGQRGLQILWLLAQEGLICLAARHGKQPTFALLDEWVPESRTMSREEALGELTRRYFTSHGPATAHDFAWWSGLSLTGARAGLEMVGSILAQETVGDKTYWFPTATPQQAGSPPTTHLLPVYDEYTVAYRDRTAALDPQHGEKTANGLHPSIVIDGRIVGTWKRTLGRDAVTISVEHLRPISAEEKDALAAAAERYGKFLKRPVILLA